MRVVSTGQSIMSEELQSNAMETEPAEGLQWFEDPGCRWAFKYILIWLMPAVLVFAVGFNLLCLVTIVINKKLFPKIARYNMIIITSFDVIVLALHGTYYYHRSLKYTLLTSSSVLMLFEYVNNGNAACKFLQFLPKFLVNGTPFFHVGLTFERVLAVVLPLQVKQIMTVKVNCIMFIVLALLGSIAPAIWAAELFHDGKWCRPLTDIALLITLDDIQYNVDFYLNKVALFAVLLAGCVIVSVALRKQTRKAAQLSGSDDKSRIRQNFSTCFVMILMNVIFFVSHGPRAAMSVYEGYGQRNGFYNPVEAEIDKIYEILNWIGFLHNIANPFSYLMGGAFRNAFMTLLSRMFGRVLFCRRGHAKRPGVFSSASTGVTGTGNAI